jgi:L-fuconolactonase
MHLWDVTTHDWYPGLRQMADHLSLPGLNTDFGPDQYRIAVGPDLAVTKFVHVSATTKPRAYLEEAAWIDRTAAQHGLDLVTIGTVDPSLGADAIRADLEQQARSPRFRGARVLYDFAADSDAARTVLDWLTEHDYVFDLVAGPDAMPGWVDTLARYPELTVVLEHTGWPAGTDDDDRQAWDPAITAIAERTTALCKLSGLGMATLDLSEAALRPWMERAIELFGWDRVAFGSNMPIETMAGTYSQLVATVSAIVGTASADEQAAFYAGNAERTYRI